MSKKILLIEDNGYVTEDLTVALIKDYDVENAYNYINAMGIWKEENGDFDCIILDLQISPKGLTDEDIETYRPVFGIAFLHKICEGKSPDEVRAIHKKTIIYSGFIRDLNDAIRRNNWDLSQVEILEKRGFGITEIKKQVNKICR